MRRVSAPTSSRLRELAVVFGTLGVIGFGGPAAHIALTRREVVERRAWLTDEAFVDYVGLTSLIPGPNSTELVMLIGRRRAGAAGLVVAGAAFILPAALIVLALAWAYVTWGTTPTGEALLLGIQPAIVALVAWTLLGLARTAVREPLLAAIAIGAAVAWVFGVNELLLLVAGAVIVAVVRGLAPASVAAIAPLPAVADLAARVASADLATLFGVFLKIGAVLYGSGYVLISFLRGDLVDRLGWLTDAQLLDAVAVGQVTPGPLFTTATFVGYLVLGIPGAVVATVAIFLPAFVLVALLGPMADRVRQRPLTAALLDGVNAAAVGLIAAVMLQLGVEAIRGPFTVAIAIGTAALLAWGRLPSAVIVGLAACAGLAASAIGSGA
jgi:chromate transporter